MRITEAEITFPCGASWADMRAIDDRSRLCAQCDTVVTDLSAMAEDDAKKALASRAGRMCIRYLYDPATNEIAFSGGPKIIPSTSLVSRAKRAAAVLAPVLLQACGGASANDLPSRHGNAFDDDAGETQAAPPRARATPDVEPTDAGVDAKPDASEDGDAH